MFLRLGTNFRPDDKNDVYLSAIGTLGHKWGRTTTTHLSNVPGQWFGNVNNMRESGDTVAQTSCLVTSTRSIPTILST